MREEVLKLPFIFKKLLSHEETVRNYFLFVITNSNTTKLLPINIMQYLAIITMYCASHHSLKVSSMEEFQSLPSILIVLRCHILVHTQCMLRSVLL